MLKIQEMSKLILVRHGQSVWNLENRFTGGQDIDLTDVGREEARKAGLQIQHEKVNIIFTSTLKRAQETLDIIRAVCGWQQQPVIKSAALNERSYGDLEGLNKTEMATKYGEEQVRTWRRSFDVQPPGGESLKDTYHRVVPYFNTTILPYLQKGENVLIVAHGNSLRSLMMFLEHLTPDEVISREIRTGVPVCYSFDGKDFSPLPG